MKRFLTICFLFLIFVSCFGNAGVQIVRRGKPLLLFTFSQRKGSNSEAEDSYEYIVTNLPAYAFSLSTIKNLYNLRWNEETAFRHLKYAGNMVHIHSLKKVFNNACHNRLYTDF